MKITRWLLSQIGFAAILVLTACMRSPVEIAHPSVTTPPKTPAPTQAPQALDTPQPEGVEDFSTATPGVHVSSTTQVPRTQYLLDVDLDYDAKTLFVKQNINYTNITGRMVKELPIQIPPDERDGIFFLGRIQVRSPDHTAEAEIIDGRIDLLIDPPLNPGQDITIDIEYQLRLPMGWVPLGYTHRQALLADWYPQIPPYLDEAGWIINPPGLVGEHLAYSLNDFEVNLCLAPSRDKLVVAASAPLIETQDHCFHYQVENRRNFTLGISPDYQVTMVDHNLVTVAAYTFAEHANLGTRAAELAGEAWATYIELFGDNARTFISIVEADIFDGLETDGLIFLSSWYYQTADPSPKNFFELLIVHEIAHQWFYGYIHNDQAKEPWLDEALSTYSELLFYEQQHPDLVDWWWQFRVTSLAPTGPVNATIYDFSQFQPYINAVYLRGATFLHALRKEVGEEAFFEGLHQYVQSEAGLDNWRSTHDFLETFTPLPGVDLTELMTEFFH